VISASAFCLGVTLFKEARSEPISTQIAVAHVVMQRRDEMQTTVCKVIKQPRQFSWVRHGQIKAHPQTKLEQQALSKAFVIAKRVLFKQLRSNKLRGKYLFFNNAHMGKRYKTHQPPVKIGKLIFY
jgi:spore germination cell wall hydrolase CwlJ-like protein